MPPTAAPGEAQQEAAPDRAGHADPPHGGDGGAAVEDPRHDRAPASARVAGAGAVLAPAARDRPSAAQPRNAAPSPSSSSILRSRLYFATRSLRDGAPVLI